MKFDMRNVQEQIKSNSFDAIHQVEPRGTNYTAHIFYFITFSKLKNEFSLFKTKDLV